MIKCKFQCSASAVEQITALLDPIDVLRVLEVDPPSERILTHTVRVGSSDIQRLVEMSMVIGSIDGVELPVVQE